MRTNTTCKNPRPGRSGITNLLMARSLFLHFGFRLYERSDLADVDIEDESLVGADVLGSALAVSKLSGNEELDVAAFADILETLGPTLDNAVEGKTHGVGFGLNLVEHVAIEESALVAHPHGVLVIGGNKLAARINHKVLQTAFGGDHAGLLAVLCEELLTGFLVGKELLHATVLKIVVEELVHLVGIDAELLAEFGVAGVALGLDEGAHAPLDLAVVEFAEIVSLDEGTEVHAHEICDAVLGCLGDLEILGSLGYGSYFFCDGGDFFALCGLGRRFLLAGQSCNAQYEGCKE